MVSPLFGLALFCQCRYNKSCELLYHKIMAPKAVYWHLASPAEFPLRVRMEPDLNNKWIMVFLGFP